MPSWRRAGANRSGFRYALPPGGGRGSLDYFLRAPCCEVIYEKLQVRSRSAAVARLSKTRMV